MRIAVLGVGGLGGYIGAKLARAGEDVTFIARGEQLEAIVERGLEVRSVHGDFHVAARATDDTASVGTVDLLLFTVKTYDTESAAADARPLVSPDTVILSLQNGVGNAERIREIVGRGQPLGGLAYIEAAVERSGVIAQFSQVQRVLVGELGGAPSERAQRIVDTLRDAGLEAELSWRIVVDLWTKWTFICAFSGLTGLCREPIGLIRETPETWELYLATMREVESVGRAKRVAFDPDLISRLVTQTRAFAASGKSSLLRDLEAGRPLEIEALNGTVAAFGRAVGVPTPVNQAIYAALLPAHRRALALRRGESAASVSAPEAIR